MSNDIRDELLDASEEALDGVIGGLRDESLTDSEGRQLLVNLIASALDAVIPTGPIDPFDDQLLIEGTDKVLEAAEAALGKLFRAVKGVRTNPGFTICTVTPCPASSGRRASAMAIRPALVIA